MMKPLTICLLVTSVKSAPQVHIYPVLPLKSHFQNLRKLENSSVDTPDIGREYSELLILSCDLMMMLEQLAS